MMTETFEQRAEGLRAAHLKPPAEGPASTARGVHHMAMIARDVEETIRF